MDISGVYQKQLSGQMGSLREIYKEYAAMTAEEINSFIELIVADTETELDEKATGSLLNLALYSYGCGEQLPQKYYAYLLEEKIFYPGQLYLRAGEDTLDALLKILEGANPNDTLQIDHLLTCIAAIPCEKSAKFLGENSVDPLPFWARKLHLKPGEYSKVMGWEIAKDQKVSKLIRDHITPFAPCEKGAGDPLAPLSSLEGICRFCKQPLSLVFEDGCKLASCLHCSCYQTVFTKEVGNKVLWHPKNKEGEFFQKYPQYMRNEEDILQGVDYALSHLEEARKPTYTANEFTYIKRSQLGGMPTAINDVSYPTCPDCGKTMVFYGQLDMADIQEYGEGIYYFFYCSDCKVCGCNYDQS